MGRSSVKETSDSQVTGVVKERDLGANNAPLNERDQNRRKAAVNVHDSTKSATVVNPVFNGDSRAVGEVVNAAPSATDKETPASESVPVLMDEGGNSNELALVPIGHFDSGAQAHTENVEIDLNEPMQKDIPMQNLVMGSAFAFGEGNNLGFSSGTQTNSVVSVSKENGSLGSRKVDSVGRPPLKDRNLNSFRTDGGGTGSRGRGRGSTVRGSRTSSSKPVSQ